MKPLKEDPGIISPDIVTLKVNGKSYTCKGKPVRGTRCKSKSFRVLVRGADLIQGSLLLEPQELAERTVYECAVCMTQLWSDPGFVVEPQLPLRNDWRTPLPIWTALDNEFHFNTDAAADSSNAKCPFHWDEKSNALAAPWTPERLRARAKALGVDAPSQVRAFDNPPYSPTGTVEKWLQFFLEQVMLGVFSVHLVPMSSSPAWFNELVVPYAEWRTFKGRIAFEDPLATGDEARTSPKQDNLLVIYDPQSDVVGHTAVHDARTGEKIWTRS